MACRSQRALFTQTRPRIGFSPPLPSCSMSHDLGARTYRDSAPRWPADREQGSATPEGRSSSQATPPHKPYQVGELAFRALSDHNPNHRKMDDWLGRNGRSEGSETDNNLGPRTIKWRKARPSREGHIVQPPRPVGVSRIEYQEGRRMEAWEIQKRALARKFPDGWMPRKHLSREAQDGIRLVHRADPTTFTASVLAERFRISTEAVRRILAAKWEASGKAAGRQDRRAKEQARLRGGPERWRREEEEIQELRNGAAQQELNGGERLSSLDEAPEAPEAQRHVQAEKEEPVDMAHFLTGRANEAAESEAKPTAEHQWLGQQTEVDTQPGAASQVSEEPAKEAPAPSPAPASAPVRSRSSNPADFFN